MKHDLTMLKNVSQKSSKCKKLMQYYWNVHKHHRFCRELKISTLEARTIKPNAPSLCSSPAFPRWHRSNSVAVGWRAKQLLVNWASSVFPNHLEPVHQRMSSIMWTRTCTRQTVHQHSAEASVLGSLRLLVYTHCDHPEEGWACSSMSTTLKWPGHSL